MTVPLKKSVLVFIIDHRVDLSRRQMWQLAILVEKPHSKIGMSQLESKSSFLGFSQQMYDKCLHGSLCQWAKIEQNPCSSAERHYFQHFLVSRR